MNIKKLYFHVVVAMTITFVLLLPDIVYSLYDDTYILFTLKTLKEVFAIFLIANIVISFMSKRLSFIILLFFVLLSFIELLHYSFFHGFLIHYEILFFFTQFSEIEESLKGVLSYMTIPIIIFVLQVLSIYIILFRLKIETFKIRYIEFLIFIALLIVPISAHKRHNISSMMPTHQSISIINTYNTISLFVGRELPSYFISKKVVKNFKPYDIYDSNITNLPKNIIVVMGESLGYKHMGLFGADVDDTPYLDSLKNDKNFIYKKGYSSGVDTLTAVPTFFTLKREPENVLLLGNGSTNILNLAKKHHYHVHYITTQKLNIMASYLGSVEDVKGLKGKDKLLIDELNMIDFSKRNLIILHQRNSHSPYEDSTPKEFYKYPFRDKDYHEFMLNSYHNSILYTDYILNSVISKVKEIPQSVVFMTSDHAEMLGLPEEDGRYGHSYLSREVAKVPFLIYYNGTNSILKRDYRKDGCYNHYNFGKLVLNSMGYSVNNPNNDGTYYIQGTSIDGTHGFINYKEIECSNLNESL